jgi:hypothetical protein
MVRAAESTTSRPAKDQAGKQKTLEQKSDTVLADIFLSQIFLFAGLPSACLDSNGHSRAASGSHFGKKSQTLFCTRKVLGPPEKTSDSALPLNLIHPGWRKTQKTKTPPCDESHGGVAHGPGS